MSGAAGALFSHTGQTAMLDGAWSWD